MAELVDRHGSAKHPERPVAKKRPDGLDDATVEALGKLSEIGRASCRERV